MNDQVDMRKFNDHRPRRPAYIGSEHITGCAIVFVLVLAMASCVMATFSGPDGLLAALR